MGRHRHHISDEKYGDQHSRFEFEKCQGALMNFQQVRFCHLVSLALWKGEWMIFPGVTPEWFYKAFLPHGLPVSWMLWLDHDAIHCEVLFDCELMVSDKKNTHV